MQFPIASVNLHSIFTTQPSFLLRSSAQWHASATPLSPHPFHPDSPSDKPTARHIRSTHPFRVFSVFRGSNLSACSPLLGHPLRGQASPGGYASLRLCVKTSPPLAKSANGSRRRHQGNRARGNSGCRNLIPAMRGNTLSSLPGRPLAGLWVPI